MTRLRALGFLLALLVAAGAPPAQAAFPSHAKVVRKQGDERVRFVGSAPGRPLTPAASTPGAAAREFLEDNAAAFGVGRAGALRQTRMEKAGRGNAVRFQQSIDGVEVLGGQFTVQLDAQNRVLSVLGEAQSGSVNTEPVLTAARAETAAVAAVAKHQQVHAARLRTSGTALKIFNDALLGGPGGDRAKLVWATTVTDGLAVKRLVLVDAERGGIAASIDQAPEARNRRVCDANNTATHLPCTTPVLSEGGSTAGQNPEVLDAYNFSGATYDYLEQHFGRDSIDDAGMPLRSTVRYCDPAEPCPYQNAFWNGSQMTYGQGFAAADDVVAHEFAHGLTEFTSGLYYYFQSGAINESMSDVFGELVDHVTPSPDDDAGDRWAMGETLGAIRHMADPGLFGDPDSMTSPSVTDYNATGYYVGTGDSGGVHKNSGVGNKAAFLMVDGGTHNGTTVTGIGGGKAAQVYYAVQTGFLTSGSDYKDLGLALGQACDNLIGSHGISAGDCQQVRNAVIATRMLIDRPEAPDVAECPTGQLPNYVYLDEITDTASGWTTSDADPRFYLDNLYATSGIYSLWGPNYASTADFSAGQIASTTIPANAFLRFSHAYDFESAGSAFYDGGIVEVSTDGGSTWTDAVSGGGVYSGTLDAANPLGAVPAFGGVSGGYKTSVISLAARAGQNARFRFRVGTDSSVGGGGWEIDDVGVYTCVAASAPAVVTGSASGVTTTAATVAGTVDPKGRATTYRLQYGVNGTLDEQTAAVSAGSGSGPVAVSFPLSGLAAATTYSYRVVATNDAGTVEGATQTFTTATPDTSGGDDGGGGGTTGGGTTSGGAAPAPTATPAPTPPATVVPDPVTPVLPARLKGTAKPTSRKVKSAKVACVNTAAKVTCKVTFRTARKKKASGALKKGALTVAKGSVKKANGKGVVTIKGGTGLFAGAYSLTLKVGRKSYKFKVALA